MCSKRFLFSSYVYEAGYFLFSLFLSISVQTHMQTAINILHYSFAYTGH